MVEEGDIKPNRMSLTTKFMVAFPGVEKIPLKVFLVFFKIYFDILRYLRIFVVSICARLISVEPKILLRWKLFRRTSPKN